MVFYHNFKKYDLKKLYTIFIIIVFTIISLIDYPVFGFQKIESDEKSIFKIEFNAKFYGKSKTKPVNFSLINNTIFIDVFINEIHQKAALDNKSAFTLIDTEFAKAKGLYQDNDIYKISTVSGKVDITLSKRFNIEIPSHMTGMQNAGIADLTEFSKAFNEPVTVIIGNEYFKERTVLISFKNQNIRFLKPGAVKAKSDNVIVLDFHSKDYAVEIMLNGIPVIAKIDLGQNYALSIRETAWNRFIPKDAISQKKYVTDISGITREQISVDGNNITVGQKNYPFINAKRGGFFPGEHDAVIGIDFLRRFQTVSIDYANGKLILIPYRNSTSTNSRK